MWKRKEPEIPVQPVTPAPAARPAMPAGAPPAPPRPATTHIGASMSIEGDIRAAEDLFINGVVKGKIETSGHLVTVGPKGKVEAQIQAREVAIAGEVKGSIKALQKISLTKEAKLIGDIQAAGIMIEDGADFKGSINIVRPEGKAAAASE